MMEVFGIWQNWVWKSDEEREDSFDLSSWWAWRRRGGETLTRIVRVSSREGESAMKVYTFGNPRLKREREMGRTGQEEGRGKREEERLLNAHGCHVENGKWSNLFG